MFFSHAFQSLELRYDVYLSYHESDEEKVKGVQALLEKERGDIKIFAERQEINEEEAWQEGIFKVMVICAK